MSTKITAKQIMTSKVIVANTATKPSQILEFFNSMKIHHLPVAENDKLLGIVSISDLVKVLTKELSGNVSMTEIDAKYTVGDIMTKNVTSVNENATLEEMLEIMGEGKFQALPITEDGNIVGIVSNRDLVRVYDWEKNHGEGSYSSGGAGFGI